MALTMKHANRILEKAGMGVTLRPANNREAQSNAYGKRGAYVLDRGDAQALTAYPTLSTSIAAALEQGWEAFDAAQLTEIELRELRAIPSNVSRLI